MRERDIRPDILAQEENKLGKDDKGHLLKKKDMFVKIPCPACESENHEASFVKDGFDFVTCKRCGTLYVNPRPTLKMLLDYYAAAKSWAYWNNKIFPATEESRRNLIFVPRVKRIIELSKKYNSKTETLVDVGAGFGTFCEEIKKSHVFDKVIAIEPQHNLAETCRRKGIEVIEKPIEEVALPNISVITSFELIEHLFWPKNFLLACNKTLHIGDLLILTTPNIRGFDLVILGKLSDNISPPNHINYFHPDSLNLLLKNCGFETVEVLTPGQLDMDIVRKKALNGELDISNRRFLKYILLDHYETAGEAFQQFLSDNKLSSHLWVLARKIA